MTGRAKYEDWELSVASPETADRVSVWIETGSGPHPPSRPFLHAFAHICHRRRGTSTALSSLPRSVATEGGAAWALRLWGPQHPPWCRREPRLASLSQPFCLASMFPLRFSAFLRGWELRSRLSGVAGGKAGRATLLTTPHPSPTLCPKTCPATHSHLLRSLIPECATKDTELFSFGVEFLPYASCVTPGKLLNLIKSYLPHLQNPSHFYQPPSRDW